MNLNNPLNILARDLVGDGKSPNLYFVSDGGEVISVGYDAKAAYDQWRALASRNPLSSALAKESALEDRQNGVLASVEPEDDAEGARLIRIDDAASFIEELA